MASRKNKSRSNNNQKKDDIFATTSSAIVAPDVALKNALTFAKKNNLKYKRNNTYCQACDVTISSSFKKLQEHVAEQTHKDKAAKITKEVISKVPVPEFIKSKFTIRQFPVIEVVINENICVEVSSYETIIQIGNRLRCLTCDVSIDKSEFRLHIGMWQHVRGIQLSSVLIEFHTEFVREVQMGVYHCGFCNFIEGNIKGMINHLMTINHSRRKSLAANRLNSHMPNIIKHKQEEELYHFLFNKIGNLFL